jgi:hypothetical protein
MKKYFILTIILAITISANAKKVKFAVNMNIAYTLQPLHASGVHITGDFQTAAGYTDWDPAATLLTQEADTDVYSIVVDIPAFRKYEYVFINGDGFYGVENPPLDSRVYGNFITNRWFYLDSLANDTTFVGVIPFSENAPVGLNLVRFKVNMQYQTIGTDSVHIAGNFQGWNPAGTGMTRMSDTTQVYECIAYLPSGNYEFKFVNGKSASGYEVVPGACASNGNRYVNVSGDISLDTVLFSACVNGIGENEFAKNIRVYPNPVNTFSVIEFNDNSSSHAIIVSDLAGRMVRRYDDVQNNFLRIEKEMLSEGIYFVTIRNKEDLQATVKLVFE